MISIFISYNICIHYLYFIYMAIRFFSVVNIFVLFYGSKYYYLNVFIFYYCLILYSFRLFNEVSICCY